MDDQTVNPDTPASGEGDHRGSDDDRTVPLAEHIAERQRRQEAESRAAQLQGQVEGLTTNQQAQSKQTETREYTHAELDEFVESGRLTKPEADRIRDHQTDTRVDKRSREVAAEVVGQATTQAALTTEIQRYVEIVPELAITGSDAFNKVAEHYARVVRIHGKPAEGDQAADLRLQLDALERAYGPADKLKRAKAVDRETHQGGDSGDGGGGDSKGKDETTGLPRDMPAKNRTYYREQIAKKLMTEDQAREQWLGYVGKKAA